MSISHRIEKIRENLNLSKSEFARKIGISHQVYSNYSTGRDIPSSVLEKICKILNVDANYILIGKESEESEEFKIPFSSIISKIKTVNNKLIDFPLKAIISLIFVLEEQEGYQKISTIDDFIAIIDNSYTAFGVKINIKTTDFSTKWDKKTLINYIEYLLDDEDINIIFLNKNYYLKYLNFLKSQKRFK